MINVMLDAGAVMPVRAHKSDAGYDLCTREDTLVLAHRSAIINTGVHVEIPEGYAGLLVSKSGLNMHFSILSTGLIDAGYTGPIVVKLYNHGNNDIKLEAGQKITQLIIIPVKAESMRLVERFAETERGDNGFGSSGK